MTGSHENNTSVHEGNYSPGLEQYLARILEDLNIPEEYAPIIEAVAGRQEDLSSDHKHWLAGVGQQLQRIKKRLNAFLELELNLTKGMQDLLAGKQQEIDCLLAMISGRYNLEKMKNDYSLLHQKFEKDNYSFDKITDIIPKKYLDS